MACWQAREAAHCGCHLIRCTLALHQHGPQDYAAGKPVRQPVQDVANHRACGGCDHPDRSRQEWQGTLAPLIEKPFCCPQRLGLFEQGQQRTLACQLHPLDYDLVLGAPWIGRQLA